MSNPFGFFAAQKLLPDFSATSPGRRGLGSDGSCRDHLLKVSTTAKEKDSYDAPGIWLQIFINITLTMNLD